MESQECVNVYFVCELLSASSHEAERYDYISFHLEQKESVKIEFKVETRTLAELQNENNSFFSV